MYGDEPSTGSSATAADLHNPPPFPPLSHRLQPRHSFPRPPASRPADHACDSCVVPRHSLIYHARWPGAAFLHESLFSTLVPFRRGKSRGRLGLFLDPPRTTTTGHLSAQHRPSTSNPAVALLPSRGQLLRRSLAQRRPSYRRCPARSHYDLDVPALKSLSRPPPFSLSTRLHDFASLAHLLHSAHASEPGIAGPRFYFRLTSTRETPRGHGRRGLEPFFFFFFAS